MSGRVRVVLAEDNPFLREGLSRLLSASGRVDVVASCASLDELLAAVDADAARRRAHRHPHAPTHTDEGVQAAARLRSTNPDVGVLVLSQYLEPDLALMLLSEGSSRRGYVLKERADDVDFLVGAITTIAEGGSVIGDEVVESLVQGQLRQPATPLAVAVVTRARGPPRGGDRQEQRRRGVGAVHQRARRARSTSTRSSPSSGWWTTVRRIDGCAPCCSTCRRRTRRQVGDV